ncbi:MAG: phosphoglucosamine mutase [Candidatus Thorarchaeota archaeon]
MAADTEKIFGTSGIRGNIARINISFALNLGRALGTILNGSGTVAMGTDARTSREMLRSSFLSGVLSTGVNVIDFGIVPMPTVAFSSTLPSIDSSVIITASHNPPTDNGFKFFVNGREFIRSEENKIEALLRSKAFIVADWSRIGSLRHFDIRTKYLSYVKKFLFSRGVESNGTKLLLDLANGAATDYTPALLHDLGFSVVTINSHQDGHFPGRPAEPSPKNLVDTMKVAAGSDYAVTLCHDGDGDRLAVIDEAGQFIDQNRVIALFARDEIERHGFGVVVTSIDTSSVIDEVVEKAGGEVIRMPLGSLQEKIALDTSGQIIFASEPWKPIFADLGPWMDGIAGASRFAQLIDELGSGSCQRLMSTIPEYPMIREFIKCPDNLKRSFIQQVLTMLPEEISGVDKILDIDGVRVDCTDGSYVLVRVSGTEPKARLYAGARTEQSLSRLVVTARNVMQAALEAAQQQR